MTNSSLQITSYLKNILPSAIAGVCAVLFISAVIEFFAWRIVHPNFSLSGMWSLSFLAGVIRTTTGAALFGCIPLLSGFIISGFRKQIKAHAIRIWSFGAVLFLFIMAGLVFWAFK